MLLLPVFAASAAVPPGKYVSWADSRHRYGWTLVDGPPTFAGERDLDPRCRGVPRGGTGHYVCSTENGGRTWRVVFAAGHGLGCLGDFARTSRTAGTVAVGKCETLPRTVTNGVFWTIDNGHRWYETTKIGHTLAGRGRHLFWTSGALLYEVRGWPPARAPRCRGILVWHPYDQRPRRDGKVCVGAVVNSGISAAVVADVSAEGTDARFMRLKPVPRGIAGVVTGGVSLRAFFRQAGANRLVTLPDQPGGVHSDVAFDGRWPFLRIRARAHQPSGAVSTHEWQSRDGGRTWGRLR